MCRFYLFIYLSEKAKGRQQVAHRLEVISGQKAEERRTKRGDRKRKWFIEIRLREDKVSFPDGPPPWSFYTLTKLTKKIPQHITWAYTVCYGFDMKDSIAGLQDQMHTREFYLHVHRVYIQKVQVKCYVQQGGDGAPGKSRGKACAIQTIHTHTHDSRLSLQHSPLGNDTGKNPGNV